MRSLLFPQNIECEASSFLRIHNEFGISCVSARHNPETIIPWELWNLNNPSRDILVPSPVWRAWAWVEIEQTPGNSSLCVISRGDENIPGNTFAKHKFILVYSARNYSFCLSVYLLRACMRARLWIGSRRPTYWGGLGGRSSFQVWASRTEWKRQQMAFQS